MRTITKRIPANHLEALVLGLIVVNQYESSRAGGGPDSVEELYDENEMGSQTFIHEYCTKRRFLKIIKGLAADGLIVVRRFHGKDNVFVVGLG